MGPSKQKLNEAALACAARNGDKEALSQLMQANWAWLKGLAYNILGDPEDVNDLMQNICVLVIENISGLREPERFKPWLATVARNEAFAYRRQRSKKPIQLEELLAEQQQKTARDDLTHKIIQDEQSKLILENIRMLPEKYREVFVLKYMKDLSYVQIGEILEIPLTTVQIRLVRARRMIYNRLNGITTNKVPRT